MSKQKVLEKDLLRLLTTNTGRHLLDSGDYYGRNWERNLILNPKLEPEVFNHYYKGVYEYSTVSVFHYLKKVLSINHISIKLNKYLNRFDRFIRCQEAVDLILQRYSIRYDIKDKECVNTYNYPSNLSQVLQFNVIVIDDNPYVLLQIHGGCDVRGGYTTTTCFKLNGYLIGNVDLYGTYITPEGNEIQVDNMYNGYSLTTPDGHSIDISQEGQLYLNVSVIDDVYMYLE